MEIESDAVSSFALQEPSGLILINVCFLSKQSQKINTKDVTAEMHKQKRPRSCLHCHTGCTAVEHVRHPERNDRARVHGGFMQHHIHCFKFEFSS